MTGSGDVIVDDLGELRSTLLSGSDAAPPRPLGLREVVRGDGAVRTLCDVLGRLGVADGCAVTILSDRTPKRYGDDELLDVVLDTLGQRFRVTVVLVAVAPTHHGVLADEETVSDAIGRVGQSAPDAVVSVGSGTVVDITKVVASELSLTHVVVQSAASVNGFSDDQSVLLINGAKRTTPSRWPDALVIDPQVVAHAPLEMTRSGLGDEVSTFTAAADWYLAKAVGFDTSYAPTLVAMMRSGVDGLMAAGTELGRGTPRAVMVLADCLTRGGLAMGAAGRTSPSSGLEHTISHLLEMHADARGVPSASHGSQVGVASVVGALVWQRVHQRLDNGDVALNEGRVATRERVYAAFAHLDAGQSTALECWTLYERKSAWIHAHIDQLRDVVDEWPRHAGEIGRLLRPADAIASTLRDARAPVAFHQLEPAPDPAVAAWALANCHLLRDRFSVVDLADLMGAWDSEDVDAVLGELDEQAR